MRHRFEDEARWSDYLAFIPVMLCMGVVLIFPGPSDQESLKLVRASVADTAQIILDLFRSRPAETQVAGATARDNDPRNPASQASSQRASIHPQEAGTQSGQPRQLWENRPSREDFSNGPSTRIRYGEPSGPTSGRGGR